MCKSREVVQWKSLNKEKQKVRPVKIWKLTLAEKQTIICRTVHHQKVKKSKSIRGERKKNKTTGLQCSTKTT